MEQTSSRPRPGNQVDARSVALLTNDQIVIRLLNTVNHLSRWLSPIHEQARLDRVLHRGDASVKQLVIRLRDEEQRVFPRMYAIATRNNPELDKLPVLEPTADAHRHDLEVTVLELQAEFRRLRQSTCSLLRSLADVSWRRTGISRRERSITIRQIADHLVLHDHLVLSELDRALERAGVR
ncbi:MAG: hypothetical protein M3457_15750, partial [Chloroflexota bacterium]|nr:hypothetical protein [Chloroflexota bacterium]